MAADIQIAVFMDMQFAENSYVLWRRDEGPCWVIDPGLPPSGDNICEHIKERNLKLERILLTHGHLDHIAGIPVVLKAFPDTPVHIASEARGALTNPHENLSADHGVPIAVGDATAVDLPGDSDLDLDGLTWKVLDTSGHSPGNRCFYCAEAKLVITGDTLFSRSVGNTAFRHSDAALMFRNIHEKLLTLPGETRVLCGHGESTSIEAEKKLNPFLTDGP